jgi:hypothetical protein
MSVPASFLKLQIEFYSYVAVINCSLRSTHECDVIVAAYPDHNHTLKFVAN